MELKRGYKHRITDIDALSLEWRSSKWKRAQ